MLSIDASGNDPTPNVNDGNGSRVFSSDEGDEKQLVEVEIRRLTLTGGDQNDGHGGAIRDRGRPDGEEQHDH